MMEAPLSFTILQISKRNAQYSTSAPIAVYRFILMDGDNGVFKAQCNSCLSGVLRSAALHSGSTVIVKKYHWIWRGDMSHGTELDGELWRGIMVIDDIDWKAGPVAASASIEDDSVSTVSVDFDTVLIDEDVMTQVAKHNSVIALAPYEDAETGGIYYARMSFARMKRGEFIRDETARSNWVSCLKKRAREEEDETEDENTTISTGYKSQHKQHINSKVSHGALESSGNGRPGRFADSFWLLALLVRACNSWYCSDTASWKSKLEIRMTVPANC